MNASALPDASRWSLYVAAMLPAMAHAQDPECLPKELFNPIAARKADLYGCAFRL